MRKSQSITQFLLLIGILIAANVVGNYFRGQLDMTEENRFTLTQPTRKMLRGLDDIVYVKVLLDGEFPAGFKRLQTAVRETLEDFRGQSGYVEYVFEEPGLNGNTQQINETRKKLAEEGIIPVNLRVKNAGESSEQLIYPYAIISYKGRNLPISLLENESPGVSPEEILNTSVSLLEYKLANGIQKIVSDKRPTLIFLTGRGELTQGQTIDFAKSLRQFYKVGYISIDSIYHIPQEISVVIIAHPKAPFFEKDKFIIDQYVMNGGKIMWLMDRLNGNLDSLRVRSEYVPYDYPTNLEDMLFKYGVRIQPDFVLDLECARIPLVTGNVGNRPQTELFPWYYHILATPRSNHPIVKGLDRVLFQFPSSIDTLKTKTPIRKDILFTSSQYSRLQFSPVRLNFEVLRYEPDPTKFDKPHQPLAVLLSGVFPSLYDGRVSMDMQNMLSQLGKGYKVQSVPTSMLVVADGDIIKNAFNPIDSSYTPTGYDRYENHTYANKNFLINALEYMLDANGVIEARSKEVKLRLLDTVKAKEEKTMWQAINIALPLVLLGAFGAFYTWQRKRKYAT